jgi:hypothetical protein
VDQSPDRFTTRSPLQISAGEGIVQPVLKNTEQLSRRLHQFVPRHLPGPPHWCSQVTPHKSQNLLSQVDAAYVAGIIDGEGTITLTRKHRNENRQLAISISSTERQLLEFIKAAVGFGKITKKRANKAHHSQSYAYAVYNRQALVVLEAIQPYLRTYKKARADLILKHYLDLTPRNGKYTEELKHKKTLFEKELLEIKANTE